MSESAIVQQRIFTLLTQEMQLPVSDPAADLIDDGVLDSLVFVDLIARLEETFGFEIDLSELEIDEFRTVEQIAGYVAANGGTVPLESPQNASAAG